MAGVLIGFGILASAAVITHVSSSELLESVERVVHSHQVITTVEELDDILNRLQAGKRAFTVTGDETYLAEFARGTRELHEIRARLRNLVSSDARQLDRLDALMPLLDDRFELLDRGIAARRERGFDLVTETTNIRAGNRTSSEIRRTLEAMLNDERSLLASREQENARSVTHLRLVLGGGLIASMVLFGLTFRSLRRENRRRLEQEQAARASEQSLATTLHSIGDGVISTDDRGRVTRMNPVAEALTGWKIDDARGRPFDEVFNIVNEKTRSVASNPVQRVLDERVVVGLENHTALVARDGTERSIADSAAPIWNATGQLAGVVVVFRDAEVERSFTRRITEANTFLDSIVENIPNMVFVKDADDLRFVRFNRAGESLLGTDRDTLIGKTDRDLFPEAQAAAFRDKDREVLANNAVSEIPEEPIDTPRGVRWLHTKKIPILDGEGRPRYLLGISEDITERKHFADQLRAVNEDLERRVTARTADLAATNAALIKESEERARATAALERSEHQLRQSQKIEAIGRLAGGIAHDFNNLLSVILSYTEMMLEDLPESDPKKPDVIEIHRAGQRAADLTRQLLAFSRQQVLAPQVLDLNAIVNGMDKLLRRVIGADIELRAVPGRDLEKVKVDPGQMEQVIMNLVVNARDAMPRGGRLTIETANVDLDASYVAEHPDVTAGRHVMLAVTDTGHGMDKATQSRIFEPFFTTKEKGKGTGLGLSTVFGIVRQSGGSIWVYSEPGAGTSFKIYLPTAEGVVVTTSTDRTPSPVQRAADETILLVEDEDQVRTLARGILTRAGYQVLEATNGEDALTMCERFSGTIHLVLTDVVMPRMSGRELVDRLATLRPAAKVLFMSGYTDDTVVHHGVLDQGLSFLQKPITPDSLLKKVRYVLGAASTERSES